ncbi:MAG: DUF342 domain-containing protein [Clostridiaceae bacterium]|nr:DUF342 domain-containing protein [Clostridiaceae bacterium]
MTSEKENITKTKNSDGLVWIKNGKVYVKNEERDGMPPLINPCKEVVLYINGVERNHLSTVNEKDTVEIKPLRVTTELQLDIEVSEDKLKCYLIYMPEYRIRYEILDSEPVNKLDIKTEEVEIEAVKTDKNRIIEFLKSKNIVFGIKDDVIEQICENSEPGKFLVAEGIPKEDPIDDSIEYFFNVDENNGYRFEEDETGNIDYKNIFEYITVTTGQVIARVHKGTPGKNGISVTGEIIPPENPKEIVITPSLSIYYDEKTGNVTANKTGRPSVQEKGSIISFNIYDSIVVDEVSIRTGNIRFKGDVEVKKNVYESMEIVAGQNVLVKGNVNFASIFAGNSISIKGTVVSSILNAAMNDAVNMNPVPLLEKLVDGINRLINNINRLSNDGSDATQLNELIRLLLNSENRDLPSTVYEVLQALRTGNYDIDDSFILSLMKKTRSLMGNYSEIPDIQYLYQIICDLKTLFSAKKHTPIKGDITLSTISNCTVTALGDIRILGKGSVNSTLYSKGEVYVAGYVRGGRIRAEKGIEINIAGSKRGSRILLSVPEDSYICIRTAYTDTTINVGNKSHTFLSEARMVYARLENGKLVY